MDINALLDEVLASVSAVVDGEVHPAWRDENTPSIVSSSVFLKLSDGKYFEIQPCEVDESPKSYPSLGLDFVSNVGKPPDTFGHVDSLERYLPSKILDIQQSDFLGEGPISQYAFTLQNGCVILIRHIYPSMTLGLEIINDQKRT